MRIRAMGIIVTLDGSEDPDGDATASVAYRASGSGTYRQGFPLSRVADTRFVGSLFWLEPGTAYDVRVTFSDPGDPLDGTTVAGTGSARAEVAPAGLGKTRTSSGVQTSQRRRTL